MIDEFDDGRGPPVDPELLLALAERVVSVLERRSLDALVIGGFALAAHRYTRTTHDLDLGLNASIKEMEQLRDDLLGLGLPADWVPPDGNDPLGGTLTIVDEHKAMVQVVNFSREQGGFPAVINDALAVAKPPAEGSRLRVVPLPHLIALKLYAGGARSRDDVRALLANNPDADLDEIREHCQRYRLHTHGLL